jgi:hypothetical protein
MSWPPPLCCATRSILSTSKCPFIFAGLPPQLTAINPFERSFHKSAVVTFPTGARRKQLACHLRNCVCLAQRGPADMFWEGEPRLLKRSFKQCLGGWVELLKRHCVLTRHVPICADTSLASEITYEPRATRSAGV